MWWVDTYFWISPISEDMPGVYFHLSPFQPVIAVARKLFLPDRSLLSSFFFFCFWFILFLKLLLSSEHTTKAQTTSSDSHRASEYLIYCTYRKQSRTGFNRPCKVHKAVRWASCRPESDNASEQTRGSPMLPWATSHAYMYEYFIFVFFLFAVYKVNNSSFWFFQVPLTLSPVTGFIFCDTLWLYTIDGINNTTVSRLSVCFRADMTFFFFNFSDFILNISFILNF